ncbi:putative G/U mismatch-specific uracil DNA glycosylase [Triangularia verruculosa]|uniref:G/U mismatch-specific uracil DNA glycosylase n=1 Tax=Triangularia verruculosa TaxID=2587418 RepID=A0AAN6XMW8_9PEZI|nr:putative G/U mismatch-specific uracil DNA glycosylase [Triangularia verruculosa]
MSETSPPPEEATDNLPTPTFAGRLRLSEFMFTSEQKKAMPPQPLRKSPRLLLTSASSTTSTPLLSPSPSKSSPSPRKRSPLKRSVTDSPEPSNSPSKRKRPKPPPTPPGPLPTLPDAIIPNLILLFVGLNPGLLTSSTGHAYAHPTNLFWRLLYSSGITPRLCLPEEDRSLPSLFSLGLTNIVPRPTRNGAELSKQEMDAGAEVLGQKIRENKPEAVCIVGKSIWESIWRVRHGRAIKKEEFKYGWQGREEDMGKVEGGGGDDGWKGARVFVACSTSGLAATLKPREKEEIWNELGEWVVKRRKEREEGAGLGEGEGEGEGEIVDDGVKQEL